MPQPQPEELARVPLLSSLSEDVLSTLATRFEVRYFDPGAAMVSQGRHGYSFYVIRDGHASVARDGQELRRLGPGDYFGEIAIMGEGRRTATVTAADRVTVWELFGTSFRELEAERPEVAAVLQQAMQERLAEG
jgi:CRP-like cAMP-binding protein